MVIINKAGHEISTYFHFFITHEYEKVVLGMSSVCISVCASVLRLNGWSDFVRVTYSRVDPSQVGEW